MPNEATKAEIKVAVAAEVAKQEGNSTGKPGFFVSFRNINWGKYSVLMAGLVGIWGSMAWIIPLGVSPATFAVIGGALGTAAFTLGYLARQTKWVPERKDPEDTGGEP